MTMFPLPSQVLIICDNVGNFSVSRCKSVSRNRDPFKKYSKVLSQERSSICFHQFVLLTLICLCRYSTALSSIQGFFSIGSRKIMVPGKLQEPLSNETRVISICISLVFLFCLFVFVSRVLIKNDNQQQAISEFSCASVSKQV